MSDWLSFKITIQTIKDYWKVTLILTLLFMGMAAMYAGMYPAFKDMMIEMVESGFAKNWGFIAGAEDMASYVGFLNIELYQIFWMLILGVFIGFITASIISKEIEAKTIDLLMANPISRKQLVFEKFIGIIPMILVINFGTYVAVIGTTIAVDEELNFGYVFLTHLVSIPYLLAIAGIGILISVIIDDKMRASIITIAIIVGSYIFQSISLLSTDYESLGLISITHYFNPLDTLKDGNIDGVGVVVLCAVMIECVLLAMLIFGRRDINVT